MKLDADAVDARAVAAEKREGQLQVELTALRGAIAEAVQKAYDEGYSDGLAEGARAGWA